MKAHLEADKRSLELCSEAERQHREFCILRTSRFLSTGEDQSEFTYQGVLD